MFIKSDGLNRYYGLCKPEYPAARFLYYLPLIALASVNIWFGVQINMPVADTICYKGGSLWPCIITHSVVNALSAFANEAAVVKYQIPVAIVMTVIAVAYALILWRKMPSA